MIWTERSENELYVYWNGELIYKRWFASFLGPFKRPYGLIFDPWGLPWSPRELEARKDKAE